MKKIFCLLICAFFLWHAPVFTDEPLGLYLTWQHSPQSSITILWVSDKDQPNDTITFQKKGEKNWHKEKGQHQLMPSQLPYLIHRVELTGLQASSSYLFRLPNDENSYKFRTMPLDTSLPLRFIVGGDMYNGTLDMLEKTNRAAAAKNPLFVVIGGDIAYSATGKISEPENGERWLDWLKVWKKTMVTSEGYLIPIIPAIGNHEVCGGSDGTPHEAQFFYALFPMPGLEGYNILDFGRYMSLILLDSGHTNPVQGAQTDWLKKVLAQRDHIPHKFAIYHVPAYPSYRNYNAEISRNIRKNWVPLFEQYGLIAAFENNDHAYKRTFPIFKGRKQDKGVLYLGDGAWSVGNVRKPKNSRQAWYIAKSAATQHFLLVTIEGLRRHFQACTPDGMVIDEVRQ